MPWFDQGGRFLRDYFKGETIDSLEKFSNKLKKDRDEVIRLLSHLDSPELTLKFKDISHKSFENKGKDDQYFALEARGCNERMLERVRAKYLIAGVVARIIDMIQKYNQVDPLFSSSSFGSECNNFSSRCQETTYGELPLLLDSLLQAQHKNPFR